MTSVTESEYYKAASERHQNVITIGYFAAGGAVRLVKKLEAEAKLQEETKCRLPVFRFSPLDLSLFGCLLEGETTIDFLLHKTNSDLSKLALPTVAGEEDNIVFSKIQNLLTLEKKIPSFAKVKAIASTLDRRQVAEEIEAVTRTLIGKGTQNIAPLPWAYLPRHLGIDEVLTALKNVGFPMIIKSGIAAGAEGSHDLAIAGDEKGILQILQELYHWKIYADKNNSEVESGNCAESGFVEYKQLQEFLFERHCDGVLIQRYIENHGPVVFKVYVAGEKYAVCPKRSLEIPQNSVRLGMPPIFIPAAQVKEKSLTPFSDRDAAHTFQISDAVASEIVKEVQKRMNLSVFGVDIIHSSTTEKYHIVDINFLPSFRGVENGIPWILDAICKSVRNHQLGQKDLR